MMILKLDHIMYAAANLEEGIATVRELTGIEATFGGRHDGAGTCNALASFGDDQYLEIIAPDPEQDSVGTMAEELLALDAPYIRTWAVAVDDFDKVRPAIAGHGYSEHVIEMSRRRPDGVQLAWQILFVTEHEFGNCMPFFINWLGSPHPSRSAPEGMQLESFSISHPAATHLGEFFTALNLKVDCTEGAAGMSAVLNCPNGKITLG